MAESNLRILGFGNPLLDISAVVEQTVLDEWGVKLNDAILAGEQQIPLYKKLASTHECEFLPGGATQNSIRYAQWMSQTPGMTAFVGCIGTDEFGTTLEKAALKDGLNVQYMKQSKEPTGTCAVLVKGGERALCANLAAANCYDKAHFETPPIQALLEQAKIVYMAGFFLTVSPPTIMAVGEHCATNNKTVCMNLSAPFIPQFFKDPLKEAIYFCDFVFGNESEAEVYGNEQGWGSDIKTTALKLAALPKRSGHRPRVVVFTQGKDATLVACGGVVTEFDVPLLPKEKLVDTNGAGDAFVGGFLAKLAIGCGIADCVNAGHYAARQVIQISNAKVPDYKPEM